MTTLTINFKFVGAIPFVGGLVLARKMAGFGMSKILRPNFGSACAGQDRTQNAFKAQNRITSRGASDHFAFGGEKELTDQKMEAAVLLHDLSSLWSKFDHQGSNLTSMKG